MSESRAALAAAPEGDGSGAPGRRPHATAGPCVPGWGRRPGRGDRRAHRSARLLATVLAVTAVVAGAALLAACGDSSGGASPSPSTAASTGPGSAPFAGSPEDAVAAYWALVDADDYQGLAAASVPGSSAALTAADDNISRARVLRVTSVAERPGGAKLQVEVRIVPASETTPWGAAGRHTLFMDLTQVSGGGWLVAGWGTSP